MSQVQILSLRPVMTKPYPSKRGKAFCVCDAGATLAPCFQLFPLTPERPRLFSLWSEIRLSGRFYLRSTDEPCVHVDRRHETIAAASFCGRSPLSRDAFPRFPRAPFSRKTRQKYPRASSGRNSFTGPPSAPLPMRLLRGPICVGIIGKKSVGIWDHFELHRKEITRTTKKILRGAR